MPIFLQTYLKSELYGGNSILDRLDPMDWVPTNPWRKVNFNVIFYFSKRGWNKLCTCNNKLEHKNFWLKAGTNK